MTILEEIIVFKKLEVDRRKKEVKAHDLEANPLFKKCPVSLVKFLTDETRTGIIAEFKRRSPSAGVINENADVALVTAVYTKYGASALSILTDEKFFGGSAADLVKALDNFIPVLQKDFIVDEYQVLEARSIGADAILLIAACLTPAEVGSLANYAKSLGLEIVLEIHNESQLAHLCDAVDIVGVNNRDLDTFEVDLQHSVRMIDKIPGSRVKIAESGIRTAKDIQLLKKHGFQGFLIGERFMREEDPGEAFGVFVQELKH